jgi:hypothetical protein
MVYGKYNYSIHGGYFMVNQKKTTHTSWFSSVNPRTYQPTRAKTNQPTATGNSVSGGNSDGLNESHMVGKWWVNGGDE